VSGISPNCNFGRFFVAGSAIPASPQRAATCGRGARTETRRVRAGVSIFVLPLASSIRPPSVKTTFRRHFTLGTIELRHLTLVAKRKRQTAKADQAGGRWNRGSRNRPVSAGLELFEQSGRRR
jgi:hypothetical protein